MKRPQNRATILRHLRAILSRAQENDFTTLAQDEALRNAYLLLGGKTLPEPEVFWTNTVAKGL